MTVLVCHREAPANTDVVTIHTDDRSVTLSDERAAEVATRLRLFTSSIKLILRRKQEAVDWVARAVGLTS